MLLLPPPDVALLPDSFPTGRLDLLDDFLSRGVLNVTNDNFRALSQMLVSATIRDSRTNTLKRVRRIPIAGELQCHLATNSISSCS